MGEQCPGAPQLKGAPKDREKEDKERKREGQGAQRVSCPRTSKTSLLCHGGGGGGGQDWESYPVVLSTKYMLVCAGDV